MEGVARAMRVAISREEEKLEQSLPFLATVGSVSPYIDVPAVTTSVASSSLMSSGTLIIVLMLLTAVCTPLPRKR